MRIDNFIKIFNVMLWRYVWYWRFIFACRLRGFGESYLVFLDFSFCFDNGIF